MRTLLTVVLLFLASEILLGQKGPRLEITPAPQALDLVAMFERHDDPRNFWANTRNAIGLIKLYYGQLWKNPGPDIIEVFGTENTLKNLAPLALRKMRVNLKLPMAIEIGAMKQYNCLFSNLDIKRAIDPILEIDASVYEAGGWVSRHDVDNAIGWCGATINDSAFAVGRWWMQLIDQLKLRLATVKTDYPIVIPQLAEIEAYPKYSINDHIVYMRKLNRDLKARGYGGVATYFLDMDHSQITDDARLRSDFSQFLAAAHAEGVETGVILNGDDENKKNPWVNKDREYMLSVNVKLSRLDRLGILRQTDVVMVQSWALEADGRSRTVPRTVPETGYTQANFVLYVKACLEERVVCGDYH